MDSVRGHHQQMHQDRGYLGLLCRGCHSFRNPQGRSGWAWDDISQIHDQKYRELFFIRILLYITGYCICNCDPYIESELQLHFQYCQLRTGSILCCFQHHSYYLEFQTNKLWWCGWEVLLLQILVLVFSRLRQISYIWSAWIAEISQPDKEVQQHSHHRHGKENSLRIFDRQLPQFLQLLGLKHTGLALSDSGLFNIFLTHLAGHSALQFQEIVPTVFHRHRWIRSHRLSFIRPVVYLSVYCEHCYCTGLVWFSHFQLISLILFRYVQARPSRSIWDRPQSGDWRSSITEGNSYAQKRAIGNIEKVKINVVAKWKIEETNGVEGEE